MKRARIERALFLLTAVLLLLPLLPIPEGALPFLDSARDSHIWAGALFVFLTAAPGILYANRKKLIWHSRGETEGR